MARSRKPRPLVIGPDQGGRSLVIAGDRVCWYGTGAAPQTPGALRLDAKSATIRAGSTSELVDGDAAAPPEGATSVILTASPTAMDAGVRRLRDRGLRVLAAVRLIDEPGANRFRALHASNRDSLVRVALAATDWEGAAALADDLGVPIEWPRESATWALERHFGRRSDLSPGAMGDALVVAGSTVRHVVVGGLLLVRDGSALPEAGAGT